jgi:hypothetical protein
MTLEKLSGGVDFVSDTTPAASDAIDGAEMTKSVTEESFFVT